MVLERAREKYHGIRYSIRLWKEATKGRLKRTKLALASKVGSREAEERLKAIEEFVKKHKGLVIPAELYDKSPEELKKKLSELDAHIEKLRAVESWAKETRELDEKQREWLADIINRAKKNPKLAAAMVGLAYDLREDGEHRKKIIESVGKLKNAEISSNWRRFFGWKVLGPLRPRDIKEFHNKYKTLRKEGYLPFRSAGMYFALYDQPELADEYRKLMETMRVLTYPPHRMLTPKMRTVFGDPKETARLADLLVKIADVVNKNK